MAYTKNTWTDGDIVTSAKLNHMEDGIEGAYEVMVINDTDGTLDKTWQEIYDAMAQGKFCVHKYDSGTLEGGIEFDIVTKVSTTGGKYVVDAGMYSYSASSATGYPVYDSGSGGGTT